MVYSRFYFAIPFAVILNLILVGFTGGYEVSLPAFVKVASWFYTNTPINLFAVDYGNTLFIFYALTGIVFLITGYLSAPWAEKLFKQHFDQAKSLRVTNTPG